ncbi:unnamed protein product [Cercopithifilaria johnstoni]|uniref:Nematode cuticle collagen N-terminal domain-containing protein n=1 Tax=Cercopithifilaria johnstoni TaxID=2874296 RepID=A0A8J2PZL3_9BILA|nr:unnamed protein product [Cercopithifilaria johnstoni]
MIMKADLKCDRKKTLNSRDEEEQHLYPSDVITEADIQHFRRVAFIAVALSTVTMLCCIIFMPVSYQYVQKVQSSILNDMEFCKSRNRDLWTTIRSVQNEKEYNSGIRFIRSTKSENKNTQWLFEHENR